MRRIERFNLVDKIGRELQSRMTYGDIDVFLGGFGIESKDGSWRSKWVYAKDRLAEAPDEVVIRIADELDLDHGYVVARDEIAESRFWTRGYFRLFLTHVSSFKKVTAALQSHLLKYGISSFVAHVDIEPTKPWQAEIEAALFSMDALAAILTDGFKESSWTAQEVGVAVGRNVLVIPVIKDLDPYGFIGKYQGFLARGKTVSEVARGVFDILVAAEKTRSKVLNSLVDTAAAAELPEIAISRLEVLDTLEEIPPAYLRRFREGAGENAVYAPESQCREAANAFLSSRGQAGLPEVQVAPGAFEDYDELPF